jgi:hypothetical protein
MDLDQSCSRTVQRVTRIQRFLPFRGMVIRIPCHLGLRLLVFEVRSAVPYVRLKLCMIPDLSESGPHPQQGTLWELGRRAADIFLGAAPHQFIWKTFLSMPFAALGSRVMLLRSFPG